MVPFGSPIKAPSVRLKHWIRLSDEAVRNEPSAIVKPAVDGVTYPDPALIRVEKAST